MGACNFVLMANGKSASEAYNTLVDYAVYCYGHDPYNGTISTCDLGRCTLSFANYEAKNEAEAYEHVKSRDYGEKWVADYVDLGRLKNGQHSYMFYGYAAC
jgi:hypothetical protein